MAKLRFSKQMTYLGAILLVVATVGQPLLAEHGIELSDEALGAIVVFAIGNVAAGIGIGRKRIDAALATKLGDKADTANAAFDLARNVPALKDKLDRLEKRVGQDEVVLDNLTKTIPKSKPTRTSTK